MPANARFAVAVHTLGMLAFADEQPVTSDRIAESVNTNPVTIRRIFQALGRAGLVIGQMGPNGGARLAREPERIDLAEVWRAVGDAELFALPASGGNARCPVCRGVQPVLREIFDQAEDAVARALAGITLAEVIGRVQARVAPPARGARTPAPRPTGRSAGAARRG